MIGRANDWAPEFLDHFVRADGDVSAAAALSGVSRGAPYKRKVRDPEFTVDWLRARLELARLRDTGARRGKEAVLYAAMRALGRCP